MPLTYGEPLQSVRSTIAINRSIRGVIASVEVAHRL